MNELNTIEDISSEQLKLNNDLIKAVKEDNVSKVKELLEVGADPHFNNDLPLIEGAMNGNLKSVKALMKATEYIMDNKEAAFYQSARFNHTTIMLYLLTQGVNIDFTSEENEPTLSIAAEHGALKAVKLLMRKGRDLNIDSAMLAAIHYNQLEVVKYFHRKDPEMIHELNRYHILYSRPGTNKNWEMIDFLLSKNVEVTKNSIDYFSKNTFIEPLEYIVNYVSKKPEDVYHILGYAILGSNKTREWATQYKKNYQLRLKLINSLNHENKDIIRNKI